MQRLWSAQRTAIVLIAPLIILAACTPQGTAERTKLSADFTDLTYPDAPRGDQVDNYHGVEVADPYRWLEELDSAPTAQWVEAQNALSRPRLESLRAHRKIQKRLTALWDHERYDAPTKEGDLYFFSHNDGLQNQSVVYVTSSLDEEPRVLLDPNGLSKDGTVSLAGLAVSPQAAHVAYALSDGGSDWDTWRIRNIESGQDLPEVLGFTKFTTPAWAADGSGFYYSRYPQRPDGHGDDSKAVAVYYHRLGSEQEEDERIFALPQHPRRNPYASVTEDGRYLVLSVHEGYLQNAVYYRDLEQPAGPVVRLLDDWDALYDLIGNDRTTFYFQTDLDAPRNRVIAIDIDDAGRDRWREVIPESAQTLSSVSMVGGHLIASYLEDAKSRIRVLRPDGSPVRDVELPGIGSASGFAGDWDDPETFYTFTSFTTPSTIYRYDVLSGESGLFRRPALDVDFDAYETRQVFFQSKDGTTVPMFITHAKGIELDGANPTLLFGYGGFSISLTPNFSLSRMVWLEQGGVLAIPNLRGGGEYGKEWHLAGTKTRKQNVFDDFLAAAEWLIDNGYTKPPRLAIQGGSNGGLLVAAALTQRPDLFGATLPAVGVLDMLRYHLPSANARDWSTDYGLSENEEEFHALNAYSPLHNVVAGTCYPPTLITTADHDDRVVPWHSFKFGAELQHGQGCGNPILVSVETRAGHGAGTPTWMRIENLADQLAFLVEMLDV